MNDGVQPPLEQFIGTLQESTLSELCKYLVMSDEQKFKESNYNFFTIKYDDEKIHENIFIKFLEEKIINYAVTYKERSILEYKDMMKMAKSLFVKKRVNSGEAGELILFLILESRGIIQLLNKMNMKQSPEKNIKSTLKSSFSDIDSRPTITQQYRTLSMDHFDFDGKILLVDDVITTGTIGITAANLIYNHTKNKNISLFTIMRTLHKGQFNDLIDPVISHITINGERGDRDFCTF